MIDRRQLLAGTAAVATLGLLGRGVAQSALVPASPLPPIDLPAPIVDIHCHIFNASDLPVYGFLRQAVFEIFDGQVQVGGGTATSCGSHGSGNLLTRPVKEAAAELMRGMMQNAITAAEEAVDLASGLATAGPGQGSIADDLGSYFGAGSRMQAAAVEEPSDYLSAEQRREIRTLIDSEGRETLARIILEEAGDPQPAAGSRAIVLRPASIAEGVASGTGFISRHLRWSKRMVDSRLAHAVEIARIYDMPSARVRLFTPALIDYSYWLNDHPKSNLQSQIDVMEQVSLHTVRTGRAKFHGYMAFDPLRDVHEAGRALSLVQHAVRDRGFVGVKMYPPMGFKPLANAGDGSLRFPKHALRSLSASQLAAALDERLLALYAWCAAEGVPILSHAANSNGSGPCYAERADIGNWFAVVAHPLARNLRLCLAHIGNFDAARDASGKLDLNALSNSWEWHFGKLTTLPSASNVYADVSYFSELLDGNQSGNINALKQAFARLIKTFPAVTDRLVYGSDWIMIDREQNREAHLKAVYWFLSDVFALAGVADPRAALIKVFSTNALRFLGLGPDEQARKRLITFYQKHNLRNATGLLDEFNI